MTRTDLEEAAALVARLCDGLEALAVDAASSAAASLRRSTGALRVETETLLGNLGYGTRAQECFALASEAGGDADGYYRLWAALSAVPVDGVYARIVRQDALRRCVVQMTRALAATDFRSRDAVASAQAKINEVFAAAEEQAADALDNAAYRALVTLHASVTRDLATRSRPLPRIVAYTFGAPQPAVVLAHRLYADAGREDELIGENPASARHPLFMPLYGSALSA